MPARRADAAALRVRGVLMRRLLLVLLLGGASVSCTVKVVRLSKEYREFREVRNVKPADSTCAEIVAGAPPVYDLRHIYLVHGDRMLDEKTRVFQQTVVQELRASFDLPDTVQTGLAVDLVVIPPWLNASDREMLGLGARDSAGRSEREQQRLRAATIREGDWDADITFLVDRAGTVDSLWITRPSPAVELHDALIAAVRRTLRTGAIPPVPDNLAAPQRFNLRLSVPRYRDTSLVALDSTWLRTFRVTKNVKMSMRPRFPAPLSAKGLNLEDDVFLSLVVDSTGLMRPGSMRVISARHAAFADEAKRRFTQMRFLPAEYRGCPVSARTSGPVAFYR